MRGWALEKLIDLDQALMLRVQHVGKRLVDTAFTEMADVERTVTHSAKKTASDIQKTIYGELHDWYNSLDLPQEQVLEDDDAQEPMATDEPTPAPTPERTPHMPPEEQDLIIEWYEIDGVYYQYEYVFKEGQLHGPFWFEYRSMNGKPTQRYLGTQRPRAVNIYDAYENLREARQAAAENRYR